MAATEENGDVKLPSSLSGWFIGSFAYKTITVRLPVILTRVVDHLFRERNEIFSKFGEGSREDTKSTIGRLSKLRNEMQTNKFVLPLTSSGKDVVLWNSYRNRYIETYGKEPKWFEASWLYVECYMYRRIYEAFELSPAISSYDPFHAQKQSSLLQSADAVVSLASHLSSVLNAQQEPESSPRSPLSHLLEQFLQISLWGNMCDLSISAGDENSQTTNPLDQLDCRKTNIIVNHTPEVVSLLQDFFKSTQMNKQLHIVLDNAGFELFTDLCLAEFLQDTGFVKTVHFYVKVIPWFVSDTMEGNFLWLLDYLSSSQNSMLSKLGKKWRQNIVNSNWIIVKENFWTLPHDFSEMKTVDPELYSKLSKADLILFKGDLNYRKLVGDRMWDTSTPFERALCGFHPAPLCALRTLKSDTVVGLREGLSEKIALDNPDWMISGEYAVIQYLK